MSDTERFNSEPGETVAATTEPCPNGGSDPDVIRVGRTSTWCALSHHMGMPVLHSNDLVNWTIKSTTGWISIPDMTGWTAMVQVVGPRFGITTGCSTSISALRMRGSIGHCAPVRPMVTSSGGKGVSMEDPCPF